MDDNTFVATTQVVAILDDSTPIESGRSRGAVATTVAVYLPEVGVLILRHSAKGAIPAEKQEHRKVAVFVSEHNGHAEAVRAAVRAADAWIAEVKEALGG